MPLSGLFPIYPDPILVKYQVSLALPPLPISKISEAIGLTAASSFLVPNVEFIEKFIDGDIGISDKMVKEAMFKTFNNPIAQKDEKIFTKFAQLSKAQIPNVNTLKTDGKLKLPKDKFSLESTEGIGFKAFEKAMLKSIFETQKPYFEVAKLVIGSIAKIEDIIARVMPLLGNPLVTKSLKPVTNAGAANRPKAIGYQNGKELGEALAKLKKLSKSGGKNVKIDKNGNAIRENMTPTQKEPVVSGGASGNTDWQIVSAVYSTGVFLPEVEYKYTYIDLPPAEKLSNEKPDLNLENDDPYDKHKPEKIILGIFKSDGTPLDPLEKIKTISLNSNGQVIYLDTPFNRAEWILNSPKWQMDNILPNKKPNTSSSVPKVFPSHGSPIYKWEKGLLGNENSKTKPGEGWSIKTYKEGQKNILDPEIDAIPNSPIIVGFDTIETKDYKDYFTDVVRYKMYQSEDLEQSEKDTLTSDIVGKLNIPSHLANVFQYSQAKSSVYKTINNQPAFPENMKLSFKPFQLYSTTAENDSKLAAYNKAVKKSPGYIWIDPEADYETKIIRVDPTTQIEINEAQGQPRVKSTIKSFIKNRLTIELKGSTNKLFSLEIKKNNQDTEILENIENYVLENWNYNSDVTLAPESRIKNNNTYQISVWSKFPTRTYHKTTSSTRIYNDIQSLDLNSLLSSNYNSFFVYDFEYLNGKKYYKKYNYTLNLNPIKLRAFLRINKLVDIKLLFNQFEENPNSSLSSKYRLSNLFFESGEISFTYIGSTLQYDWNAFFKKLNVFFNEANNGLVDINQKRVLKFTYNNTDYYFKERVDALISMVLSTVPTTDSLFFQLFSEILSHEYTYTLKLKDLFHRKTEIPLPNGVTTLADKFGTRVYLQNQEIVRWYYIYQHTLLGPNSTTTNVNNLTQFSLPPFGKEYKISINHDSDPQTSTKNLLVSRQEVNINQYNIKATANEFPYGKIIDPSRVANQILETPDLYSKGKYGHGSNENPQEIEVIKRYMLTDLDTESYYIIEGILTDKNKQTDNVVGSKPGEDYYKLPHAIGAIKVFLSLAVDIAVKLLPQMLKIIKLFSNPANFVVEIIKEKMGEGFSIFSKESFKTFETAAKEKDKLKNVKPSERERKIKGVFSGSPLQDHVFVNNKGDFKFLLDGLALLPFSIFGLPDFPFGMELNFDKIPETPIKLIFKQNLNTAKVKNLQQFLNPKIKDFKGPGSDGLATGLNLSDLRPIKNDSIYKNPKKPVEYNNPNNFEVIDIKYSTGTFINGIDYNYVYINQDTENVIKNAENLINEPDESVDVEKLKLAIEDLENELKKDPNNKAIKDALKKLKAKKRGVNDSSQPILKMLLGFVTLPIKIIGGIIEWLINFFKSLTNPLTLPSKIVELLSFSWIMKFFTPLGILELAGVKFEPKKILEWCVLVNIPNVLKPPTNSPEIPQGVNLPELKYYKDAFPKGRYLIPDDYELVDWHEILSMPFMPKLPIYTARQHREMCTRPVKMIMPTLCLIEKVINGIIDFIWSILGIEPLIPAPHIKLCSKSADPDISDLIKIKNDLDKDSGLTSSIPSGKKQEDLPADAGFLYDITLDNGTVVKGLNYEEMKEYLKKHEDVGYDFQF